jgi:hypothetical protein
MIGASIGFMTGAVLGGGPFGGIGMIVGGGLGGLIGAMLLPALTSASATEYARHPHLVNCPEIGKSVPVTVAPESVREAFFKTRGHARVADCPRWRTRGKCDAPCEKDLTP